MFKAASDFVARNPRSDAEHRITAAVAILKTVEQMQLASPAPKR